MRIAVVGQFGFNNIGDEGILQAITDSLGLEHEYIVCTPLPFTMLDDYKRKTPTVSDVRNIEDTRTDFDACIYGGGKVDWGFGWGYFMRAFALGVPTMAYGVGFTKAPRVLWHVCRDFLELFRMITVRGVESHKILEGIEAYMNEVTACPAFSLKEERADCPEGKIAVCPRYGDFNEKGDVDNNAQVDWTVQRLAGVDRSDILLIPFFPKDLEGQLRDLEVCQQINRRLGGGCSIFSGLNPRKVKYAISRSKLVISGGRYHAIVWAMAHGIPYEIAPTVYGVAKAKLDDLVQTRPTAEAERRNKELFELIT